MKQLRVSAPARQELAAVLDTSGERWGEDGRLRYKALLDAAVRAIAEAPDGPLVRDRSELGPGFRSLHVRHVRRGRGVRTPVHVIYFRVTGDVIDVLAVLHERMNAREQLAGPRGRQRRRSR